MSRDLSATRQFFGPRAAGWDEKFPDDGPVFAAAIALLLGGLLSLSIPSVFLPIFVAVCPRE